MIDDRYYSMVAFRELQGFSRDRAGTRMRAGEPYKLFCPNWRAKRCVLTLGLVPVLILRPAHGGAVILHDHGPHQFHAHRISLSQLEDWCDEHDYWHKQQEPERHDVPGMPTPDDPTNDTALNDATDGAIVVVHRPLLAHQSSRLVLPLERCSVVPAFGMFFGAPPGQSLERHGLLDDTTQPFPGGLSATTAILLRSHALLI